MPKHTKAGDKLIFHFQNTEIGRLILESVEKIEQQAYDDGYADGIAAQEVIDLDAPVMFPEESS